MQVPTLPKKPERHIDNATAGFMIATAIFFDALDLAPSALMTVATAAAASVGWIPFLGQLVGIAAIGAGIIIEWALSTLIAFTAFFTFFIWFRLHGVSLGLINKFAVRRLLIWLICVLIESLPVPFFSALPMLTIGTIASILISRGQDREERLEWEGKLSRLERLFWRLARTDATHSAAQLNAVLKGVQNDRRTHAKLKMALQQRTMRAGQGNVVARNDTTRLTASDNPPLPQQEAA